MLFVFFVEQNKQITKKIDENLSNEQKDNLTNYTNKFIKKMGHNLDNFNYNIIIANIHEMHSYFYKEIKNNYSAKTLINNYKKIYYNY